MRSLFSLALALAFIGSSGRAAEPVDYVRKVKPILAHRCYACHGALQQKAGLRLDTAKSARAGGDNGPVVVAGKSSESLLIERVSGSRRMPPASEGDGLKPDEIALLRAWIDQGAAGPTDEKPEPDPREHWAFRAPVRPAIPAIKMPVRNSIDAFLAAEQEKRGLTPQSAASKRLLLRRVYLDLIGLPPTAEELAAFETDTSKDAYEKVVDRLLASKQHGERWGRHWMDVWRYSDWWGLGAEVRNSQKHMWHWRDWILESLNADKGYDQMVREMLAADELYPEDLDRIRATGFLVRQYFIFNRSTWMEDAIEHTSKAFLGLTMNCAKCHDHKFDPISQQDFYRFRAFFEPYHVRLEQLPGEADLEKDGLPRAFDFFLDAPTYRFIGGDDRNPDKSKVLPPGLPALLTFEDLKIQPLSLPAQAHAPGLRPYVLDNLLKGMATRIVAARTDVDQARKKMPDAENDRPTVSVAAGVGGRLGLRLRMAAAKAAVTAAEKALAAAESQPASLRARAAADKARMENAPNAKALSALAAKADREAALKTAEATLGSTEVDLLRAAAGKPTTDALNRRNAAKTALDAAVKALATPGETYTPLNGAVRAQQMYLESLEARTKPYPTTSTGRRTALARWLTDRRHPLTARVAVNHIWARHFGKPLVPTVFDFGRKGTPPTHPALLDWLAVEFMDKGWSMKHLHKLMVLSDAYQRSSSAAGAAPTTVADDAENRFYWRMNPTRMEAQAVRDSLLHLAGELDPTMGGPSIAVGDTAARRRSLYFIHSHNDHHKFLSMFDDADVKECYRRSESIVPVQALALSNSGFALAAARKINDRLHARLGNASDSQFVRAAFETILAGTPTAAEQAECEKALTEVTALLKAHNLPDAARRARGDLVQALLNHNDFITIR